MLAGGLTTLLRLVFLSRFRLENTFLHRSITYPLRAGCSIPIAISVLSLSNRMVTVVSDIKCRGSSSISFSKNQNGVSHGLSLILFNSLR